jgi:hypothetical protein
MFPSTWRWGQHISLRHKCKHTILQTAKTQNTIIWSILMLSSRCLFQAPKWIRHKKFPYRTPEA